MPRLLRYCLAVVSNFEPGLENHQRCWSSGLSFSPCLGFMAWSSRLFYSSSSIFWANSSPFFHKFLSLIYGGERFSKGEKWCIIRRRGIIQTSVRGEKEGGGIGHLEIKWRKKNRRETNVTALSFLAQNQQKRLPPKFVLRQGNDVKSSLRFSRPTACCLHSFSVVLFRRITFTAVFISAIHFRSGRLHFIKAPFSHFFSLSLLLQWSTQMTFSHAFKAGGREKESCTPSLRRCCSDFSVYFESR